MTIVEAEAVESEFVPMSREVIKKIGRTLEEVAYAQLALHKFAESMHDYPELKQAFAIVVREITRASAKRLDACMGPIPGASHLGNFDDELEDYEI
ncbi:hypothetical protein [Methyloversatilis discipulorum]|uniref:hypothetical protein n=1 Tax=Methyloversatilis discipulorum TaxID=1119528 RepID=UPI001A4BF20F|nr:hypothetical protein [Methyloversatilis discipulorum]MBL8466887.1 hypothetical protein [Methyloversatilis discipulorum]